MAVGFIDCRKDGWGGFGVVLLWVSLTVVKMVGEALGWYCCGFLRLSRR